MKQISPRTRGLTFTEWRSEDCRWRSPGGIFRIHLVSRKRFYRQGINMANEDSSNSGPSVSVAKDKAPKFPIVGIGAPQAGWKPLIGCSRRFRLTWAWRLY